MTPDLLIFEGRRFVRPCVFLRPTGNGPVAAYWHQHDAVEIEATGYRCWITVDARFVPGLPTLTVHDSEPWVEAWRLSNGQFKVIQRIT